MALKLKLKSNKQFKYKRTINYRIITIVHREGEINNIGTKEQWNKL